MTRMASVLPELAHRISALALPLPMEHVLLRTLGAEGFEAKLKRVFSAWELAAKCSASAVWGLVRARAKSSEDFERQCDGLERPSMGIWVGLLRAGLAVLDTQPEGLELLQRAWLAKCETEPEWALAAEKISVIQGALKGGESSRAQAPRRAVAGFDHPTECLYARRIARRGGASACRAPSGSTGRVV